MAMSESSMRSKRVTLSALVKSACRLVRMAIQTGQVPLINLDVSDAALEPHHDLAEMLVGFHVFERLADVVEGKHLVDRQLQPS